MKGDSFSSAHTWGKCSFVTEIIQHVEYSVPMARVAEIAQNATAHWGNLLDAQLIAPVCAGLNMHLQFLLRLLVRISSALSCF